MAGAEGEGGDVATREADESRVKKPTERAESCTLDIKINPKIINVVVKSPDFFFFFLEMYFYIYLVIEVTVQPGQRTQQRRDFQTLTPPVEVF